MALGMGDQVAAAALRGMVITVSLVALVPAAAWVEERVEARVRGRRGRRGPAPFGLLSPLVDALALLTKGATRPGAGDRRLLAWAPLLGLLPAALLFGVAALSTGAGVAPELAAGETSLGLLVLLALSACLAHSAALAGPGAGSRGAAAASVRALTTHSGALLAWGLCLVAVAAVHGSARLSQIGADQSRLLGFAPLWNLGVQPLGFAVFLTAALALNQRAPFGATRSAELGGGLDAVHAGPRLALLIGARQAFTLAASMAATYLYLGGSSVPGVSVQGPVATLSVVVGKSLAVVAALAFLSASLPRLTGRRAAQVTWRVLVPAAGVNLVLAGLVAVLLDLP